MVRNGKMWWTISRKKKNGLQHWTEIIKRLRSSSKKVNLSNQHLKTLMLLKSSLSGDNKILFRKMNSMCYHFRHFYSLNYKPKMILKHFQGRYRPELVFIPQIKGLWRKQILNFLSRIAQVCLQFILSRLTKKWRFLKTISIWKFQCRTLVVDWLLDFH